MKLPCLYPGPGIISSLEYEIDVPGNPADAVFFPNTPQNTDSDLDDISDYFVYFPLARNTNTNNVKAAAGAGADVTNYAYISKPADCKYEEMEHDHSAHGGPAHGGPSTP